MKVVGVGDCNRIRHKRQKGKKRQ